MLQPEEVVSFHNCNQQRVTAVEFQSQLHFNMDKIKPVISILFVLSNIAWAIVASAGIDSMERIGEFHLGEGRSKYPAVTWFPGKSFCNCGSAGNITNIDITKCEMPPCSFVAGDELELEFQFVTDRAFEKLDLEINLVEQRTGEVLLLRHLRGTTDVQPGDVKSTFTILKVNTTIPNGNDWYFEILRISEGREVCARFPTTVISNFTDITPRNMKNLRKSPDEEHVLKIESLPNFGSVFNSFVCEEVGNFPDPKNCTKYHVCQYFPNGTLWDQVSDCPAYTVWCQERQWCDYPSICPCELPQC